MKSETNLNLQKVNQFKENATISFIKKNVSYFNDQFTSNQYEQINLLINFSK